MIPAPTRTEERARGTAVIDSNGEVSIRLPRRRPGQPCIVSRLIAAIPANSDNVLRDTFERVVAAGGCALAGLADAAAAGRSGGARVPIRTACGTRFTRLPQGPAASAGRRKADRRAVHPRIAAQSGPVEQGRGERDHLIRKPVIPAIPAGCE